ncbi:MAG: hypothetical protein BWY06_02244 [Candidatus Latescibacteria bacterium ADurb.Bin168]|nr:MAG: hypothetical protein BWY06_02244 [Candidatus Latescibacteria bacterium ADurb.Bin168]
MPPDHDVLNGHGERVPHMKTAGNIRRRNDNAEGFFFGDVLRVEGVLSFPEVVPAGFDFPVVVTSCQLGIALHEYAFRSGLYVRDRQKVKENRRDAV